MKIKSLTNKVPYDTIPAGGVFTREDGSHAYINLNYMVFDTDGYNGFRYNAVDLIDGDAVYIENDELVLYYPDAIVSL